jgi:hypothetical protein
MFNRFLTLHISLFSLAIISLLLLYAHAFFDANKHAIDVAAVTTAVANTVVSGAATHASAEVVRLVVLPDDLLEHFNEENHSSSFWISFGVKSLQGEKKYYDRDSQLKEEIMLFRIRIMKFICI